MKNLKTFKELVESKITENDANIEFTISGSVVISEDGAELDLHPFSVFAKDKKEAEIKAVEELRAEYNAIDYKLEISEVESDYDYDPMGNVLKPEDIIGNTNTQENI